MRRIRRWLTLSLVLASGYVWADHSGHDPSALFARLIGLVTPAPPPGQVTETERPDLSGSDPNPDPVYGAPTGFVRHDLTYAGAARHWYMLAPAGSPGSPLLPVIVVLHGSGRNGASMLDMWRAISASDAVLVAPDAFDSNFWSVETDGPAFLDAVLDAAEAVQPFDRGHTYRYGHSAGARYALYLADCVIGPWRAVAVHAGSMPDCAARHGAAKVPVLIQIGDRDHLFDLAAVRQSAATLARNGHDVRLDIIPRHSHWIYDVGGKLARDAWAFFAVNP